jgi:hypothetical protein
MDRVVQDHEDHVFLKIRVEPEDTDGGRAELSLAEELTVLDAMQVFDLGKSVRKEKRTYYHLPVFLLFTDVDAIAKQSKCPHQYCMRNLHW